MADLFHEDDPSGTRQARDGDASTEPGTIAETRSSDGIVIAEVMTGEEDDERGFWDDDRVTVLHEQPQTAVYRNRRNGVVIRQRDTAPQMGDDDDQWLFFADDRAVEKLIYALAKEIGLDLTRKGGR